MPLNDGALVTSNGTRAPRTESGNQIADALCQRCPHSVPRKWIGRAVAGPSQGLQGGGRVPKEGRIPD